MPPVDFPVYSLLTTNASIHVYVFVLFSLYNNIIFALYVYRLIETRDGHWRINN
jgi:uncharacterized membrane protein YsdA (DUF1294 family)